MRKIWYAITMMVILFSCKGSNERVDLSKKTKKCTQVYEDSLLPVLEERTELFNDLSAAFTHFGASTDNGKQFCDSVVDSFNSSRAISILDANDCMEYAESVLEPYGGCSEYSKQIASYCSDPGSDFNHPFTQDFASPSQAQPIYETCQTKTTEALAGNQ